MFMMVKILSNRNDDCDYDDADGIVVDFDAVVDVDAVVIVDSNNNNNNDNNNSKRNNNK